MNPELVRKRLSEHPFRAFELWLNSGQVVRVPHPEFAFLPPKPNHWDMVVYEEDKTFAIIDLAHVTAMKEVRASKRNGRGPAK
jgi:hypothetical protein